MEILRGMACQGAARAVSLQGKANKGPAPQPLREASKASPVRVTRIGHSPLSTRDVYSDKAGQVWLNSVTGQGLGSQQQAQSQG